VNGFDVNLRLPTGRHTVQEKGAESLFFYPGFDLLEDAGLFLGQ